jgi:hypothetical protein
VYEGEKNSVSCNPHSPILCQSRRLPCLTVVSPKLLSGFQAELGRNRAQDVSTCGRTPCLTDDSARNRFLC